MSFTKIKSRHSWMDSYIFYSAACRSVYSFYCFCLNIYSFPRTLLRQAFVWHLRQSAASDQAIYVNFQQVRILTACILRELLIQKLPSRLKQMGRRGGCALSLSDIVALTQLQYLNSLLFFMFCRILYVLSALLALAHACLNNYEYYDYVSDTCMPCSYNCLTCFDQTICVACVDEYFLNSDNQCEYCPFGCAVCSDSSSCSSCMEGLYMDAEGDCVSCANGVKTCTIALVQSCLDGYFMLGDICAGCLDNCAKCYDFVECVRCFDGYYVSADATECLACGPNCNVCQDSSICTSCDAGYSLSGSVCVSEDCSSVSPFCRKCAGGICQQCSDGTYADSDGSCSQGASLLCTTATGPYFTNCETSMYDCPSYATIQIDMWSNTQTPVCLPKRAGKDKQYQYFPFLTTVCPNSACTTAHTETISFSTLKAFYDVEFVMSLKAYGGAAAYALKVQLQESDGTVLAASMLNLDLTDQLTEGLTDSDCNGCSYGYAIATGKLTAEGGGPTKTLQMVISSSSGLFAIRQILISASICKVDRCSECSSAVSCNLCLQPYYIQMIECVEECDPGFYKNSRSCVLTCPTDTYPVRSSYTCNPCESPCETCTSQTSCLSCLPGFFLDETSCVTECITAETFTNLTSGKCEPCPNPCTTCEVMGTNDTQWSVNCVGCGVGYLLAEGSCTYICPQGTFSNFVDNFTKCTECLPECSSCYIESSVCLACEDSFLLNENTCESGYTCAEGYYEVETLNICAKCHYPCQSCVNNSRTCTSCLKGSLYNATCPLNCPDGYYTDHSTNISVCQPCSSPCINCLSQTTCLTCQNGTFYYQGQCYTQCPVDTHYQNSANRSCVPCVPPCSQCLTVDQCLTCTTGFIDLSIYKCVMQCNDTSYVDSDFVCQQCVSPCTRCYSDTSCFRCELPSILYGQICITVSECQSLQRYVRYYLNYTSSTLEQMYAVCDICTYPCASCINSPIVCSTCAGGYLLVTELSTCVQECPQSYFQEGTQCTKCDGNCFNCDVVATNCTACGTGMYLYDSQCLLECPDGYYASNQDSTCRVCQDPCATCYNRYLCKSCQSGILYNKVCVDSCAEGSIHNMVTNQCEQCTNNCLTCEVQTSNCTKCPSSYYLHEYACLQVCPDAYYGEDNTRTCEPCIDPCLYCSQSSVCLSCVSDYYLLGDQCLFECPEAYYSNQTELKCDSCNLTICRACSLDANNCTLCASGYFMDSIISNQCVTSCPSGSYADTYTLQCQQCTYPCSECLSRINCTQCQSGYMLYMDYCYSSCPIGYFSDGSGSCEECADICEICTDLQTCLKCRNGYYANASGICVTACEIGYYAGSSSLTNYPACLPCPTQCLACTEYYNCIDCQSTPTILYLFNGLCLDQCPIMHYSSPSPNLTSGTQSCSPCSDYCNSCINSTYCVQCLNSYIYNYSCYVSCPKQTYLFNDEQCLDCVAPCLQCTGQFSCVTCLEGYFYFQNYCVVTCPEDVWKYPENSSCYTTCPYNKYVEERECYVNGCGGMLVINNGYCLDSCPQNSYVDLQQSCKPCSNNKKVCQDLLVGQLAILRTESLKAVITFNQQIKTFSSSLVQIAFIDLTDPQSSNLDYPPTSIKVDANRVTIQFSYRFLRLYELQIKIPFAPSVSSAQSLSFNTFEGYVYAYNDYEDPAKYHKMDGGFLAIGVVLVVLTFLIIIANIILKASHYMQLIDFMQFIAVSLYLQIQYPPVLEAYLRGLGSILFNFFPSVADFQPYSFSPSKFIEYFTDTSLLRSQGLTFILFILILSTMLIIVLINHFKPQKLKPAVERIVYRHLLDLFTITMLPLMIFSFWFKSATPADMFASSVVLLASFVFLIVICYKLITAKEISEIRGLAGEMEQMDSKMGQMYTPVSIMRKIIFALVLCIQPEKPISTLTLLLILTILILVCLYFYQPFQNQITDYVAIFMEMVLVVFVFILILFGLNSFSGSSANSMGMAAVIITLIGFIVGIGWTSYLTFMHLKKILAASKQQVKDANPVQEDPNVINVKKREDRPSINLKEDQQNSAQQLFKDNLERAGGRGERNGVSRKYHESQQRLGSSDSGNEQFRHWNASDSDQRSQQNDKNERSPPAFLIKMDRQQPEDEHSIQ